MAGRAWLANRSLAGDRREGAATVGAGENSRMEVSALRRGEADCAAWLLARAFDDDPLFGYLFPHQGRRARALRAIFKYGIRDAMSFGRVDAVHVGNALAAAAVWLPPGAFPPSASRNLRMLPALLAVTSLFPASLVRVSRTLAADTRAHIEKPHWYLQAIGVDPPHQGHGVGTALLEGVLSEADDQRHACYLVTSSPRNLAWYTRFGFERLATVRPEPASPPFWPMQRQPR